MAIAFDAASSGVATSVSPLTWTHTCTGTNLVIVVGVAVNGTGAAAPSAVSYNGVALTKIRDDSDPVGLESVSLWYLKAPATGAHTVSVTFPATANAIGGAVSLTGVDQTVPLDANNGSGTATQASPISVTITTVANNAWTVDAVMDQASVATTLTATGTGQTKRLQADDDITTGLHIGMSTIGPKSPAGATTDSWTSSNGAGAGLMLSVGSFKPAAAAGPTVDQIMAAMSQTSPNPIRHPLGLLVN